MTAFNLSFPKRHPAIFGHSFFQFKWNFFLLIFGLLFLFLPNPVQSFEFERRRDQFINTPGYLILPVPYSYPGIGEGIVLVGYAGNAFETKMDAILLGFNGDAEGYYLLLNEIYLVDEFFYLNGGHMQISKFGIQRYETRGMETEKDQYALYVGNKYQESRGQAVFSLLDRRLEFWYAAQEAVAHTTDIYDPDDNLLAHYDEPEKISFSSTSYGVQLDLTDDRTDPRSGLRLKSAVTHHPPEEDGDPNYDVLTQSATLYIPILEDSTWVFHYFRSEAKMIDEGETDIEVLKVQKGVPLCGEDPVCIAIRTSYAMNTQKANRYGTAESLGGAYRLRSYPESRYNGAHTEMRATELRWNISTEQSKVDLYFLQDIVHAIQLALFWEEGSVSETEETLGDITRETRGAGFRFVAESGNVYRLDWADGDEGTQVTALFQYPWGESD